MNPPPHHLLRLTEDGSITLFSEQFQEACHSMAGAKAETILHYIQGCEVVKKLNAKESISILEVGFGLGVGFLTTYESLRPLGKKFSFLSLEIDRELLNWFMEQHQGHPVIEKLKWVSSDRLESHTDLVDLIILCGDARDKLPTYLKEHPQSFDAIYQDAFSPKKNPTLWTKQWFKLLHESAALDATLSTYSSSSSIRKSLMASGWSLSKGERFGPKRSSTRAQPFGETDPEILSQLERSPVDALCDDNLLETKRLSTL
jgi:tRNA U34 5-methylaminomethyl-2-thiouridine-forming methyltransferase MnmC